jgi:hypothetical protein
VRTFIVRLRQDASGGPGAVRPRLCGVVDEVATGMRTTFRDDQELVTALTTAIGAEPSGPAPTAGGRDCRKPSLDQPDSSLGGKEHVTD